ncbi:MAG: sulfoxide reductase heme-binding subunit YedZ [Gammaproteobacteria bacterium]|nr:MAG: sulfoxide reductase heme-binding subunit YedZ [Gammaproteobacteria bacterium]
MLAYRFYSEGFGANPIETINRYTGDWALRILLLTLAFSPLIRITRWHNIIQYRRMVGLFAFFYVCVHLSSYIVLDQFFDFSEIIDDVFKRPFITAGFSAFILLIPLAVTSTNKMVERLQYRWIQLHRIIYLIGMLTVLHFWWMVKIDTREPMIYAIILAILLGFRLVFYLKRKV